MNELSIHLKKVGEKTSKYAQSRLKETLIRAVIQYLIIHNKRAQQNQVCSWKRQN